VKNYTLIVVFLTYLLSTIAIADNCTHYPIGLSKFYDSNKGKIIVSVAKANIITSEESAKNEAKINARALLNKEKENIVNGAIDLVTCIEKNEAFYAFEISEKSIKQANKLKNQINDSFKKAPTPIQQNLPIKKI
jgi:hypothetical protein